MTLDRPGSAPPENAPSESLNLLDLVGDQQAKPAVPHKAPKKPVAPCEITPAKDQLIEDKRVLAALHTAPMDGQVSKTEEASVGAMKDLITTIQKNFKGGINVWVNQISGEMTKESQILSQIPPEHMQAFLGAVNKSLTNTNCRLALDPVTNKVWMGENVNGKMVADYVAYNPKYKA